MFNIKKSSNSEEEYIAKVLATFLKIRQQEEKSVTLQLTQLLQSYKQEEINHLHSLKLEQQKMEKQIYVNLKKENQQPKTNEKREEPVKPVKSSTTAKIKGDKYSEYGLFENGAFTCLKCQSRVKRTQDLLKHWTMQHGRQAIPRRKRNFVNEDTQCVKKISQETLKSEAQSDL